jgi:transposase
MLPQCSHITKKRGVYYYRRRIPQSPNCEVVLSLRTRVFRVAECLADGLDQEFRRLIQGVTTDDNTDLAAILRTYLKQRLDHDMRQRADTSHAPMFGSPMLGRSHASVDLEWIDHELAAARGELAGRAYKRHGTTTLFAALNILDGTVIGRNMQRHRHQEFIRFLNTIEEQVPVGKVIHAIVDNYATHKHPKVRQWLARHPRWTFHFTPTSASWLNAVEGFFSKLTRRRLKRGVFRSVVDLQVAINRFVAETNADPKPFVWTADPKRVLAAVKCGKQTLESLH